MTFHQNIITVLSYFSELQDHLGGETEESSVSPAATKQLVQLPLKRP